MTLSDEGITGTSAAKREDFQRMMADCRRGLIDQILVKSISRFARNTKDCLEAVRELKELGVNVRFEREGIDTANVSSELITAIYAAFAQKESESISGNMRWSYQRRMESGEFNTCRAPWGFRLDGKSLAVHEEEAEIVRRIFLEYLSGRNPREIAEILNAEDTSGRISKSNELTRQLRQAKLDKEELMDAEGDATAQRTRELIALLEDGPDFLDRPDTELCGALVAEIIVESNDTLRFHLHNGLELRESIERTVR